MPNSLTDEHKKINQFAPAEESEFIRIPTADPRAALRFCQALAKSLTNKTNSVLIDPDESQDDVQQAPPAISVVIPVYDEEENLPILYERLRDVLSGYEPDYELIFVDDGSRDKGVDFLQELVDKDPRVVVIQLARNFGHQVAISAGLDFSRGEGVIIMDADLQDPPEVLPKFIEKWREGHDIVYAIRTNRKEGWFKRNAYAFFYRILQRIAAIQILTQCYYW